jgi:hypothetical protein
MRERSEQILKIVCLGLAILLVAQFAKIALHVNPLAGVVIPDLPSLPAETNAVASTANKPPAKTVTNAPASSAGPKTNATMASADTNAVLAMKPKASGSNSSPVEAALSAVASHTNVGATDSMAAISIDTNALSAKAEKSTNTVAADPGKKNSPKKGGLPPGLMAGPPGAGAKTAKLAPEIEARVDRVTDSEILGPVIHPMPMALLGIAGKVAFLRSASGQTGLVKEGEDLGEIKLLRIGTNRVLIEQNGEKKELVIFAGLGGESLLPKPTESPNETTNRN